MAKAKDENFNETESTLDINESLKSIEELMKQQKAINDSLNKIEYVDMEKIKVVKADVLSQQESINTIFNSKPSFQVVCSQSGYMAKLAPMVYRDIVAITNSNLSTYENKKETYKIIYSKITGYSVDNWKPSFEEWLDITSLGDYETLLYGLYCATFQDTSVIRYECPHCGELNIVNIDNKNLIRIDDRQEMLKITNKISKDADTVDKIKEYSSVSDNKKNKTSIRLPDSKIIFTIKMPTLSKTLSILKKFSDADLAAKSVDAQNILLATDSVALPDKDGSYSYIEDITDIFKLLDVLSIDDMAAIKQVVTKLLNEKHITYYVDKQVCPKCGKDVEQIPLDIESLLFFQISERQLS